jgi:cell division protein FtsI (penicillin-binding protein 3)
VMDGTLRLMDVPPDDIETWLAVQAKNTQKTTGGAPGSAAAIDDVPEATDLPAFAAPQAVLPEAGATR